MEGVSKSSQILTLQFSDGSLASSSPYCPDDLSSTFHVCSCMDVIDASAVNVVGHHRKRRAGWQPDAAQMSQPRATASFEPRFDPCSTSDGAATEQFKITAEELERLCQHGKHVGEVGSSILGLIPPWMWEPFIDETLRCDLWSRTKTNEARPPPTKPTPVLVLCSPVCAGRIAR